MIVIPWWVRRGPCAYVMRGADCGVTALFRIPIDRLHLPLKVRKI